MWIKYAQLDKPRDQEIRQHKHETGGFTTSNSLWSEYCGWTPYQYSMNKRVGD